MRRLGAMGLWLTLSLWAAARSPALAAVLALLVAGCGGRSGAIGPGGPDASLPDSSVAIPDRASPPPPDLVPAGDLFPVCPPAKKIGQAAELAAIINGLTWPVVGSVTTNPVAPTGDQQMSGDVILDAVSIKPSISCPTMWCPKDVLIVTQQSLAGVTCLRAASSLGRQGCARLRLGKGATVRFRALAEARHPGPALFIVQVLQACAKPCPGGLLRCPRDNTCWQGFDSRNFPMDSFCRLCLGHSLNRCTCSTAAGPKPDGTKCTYHYSADLVDFGFCKKGECIKKP